MYHIEGAVIKEQGVTFAIVIVKSQYIQNNSTADDTRRGLFPSVPWNTHNPDGTGFTWGSHLSRTN